jgi:hypothetical protein
MIKNEMLMRNYEKDKNKAIKEYRENVISKLTENSVIKSCLESITPIKTTGDKATVGMTFNPMLRLLK